MTVPKYDRAIIERLNHRVGKVLPTDPEFCGPLFHYTSAEGLIGILQKYVVYATSLKYLNDVREWTYGADLVMEGIGRIYSNASPPIQEALNNVKGELDSKNIDNWFATCFCAEGDLLTQWCGYGGGSSGYCIEFDTTPVLVWAEQQSVNLVTVEYEKPEQQRLVELRLAETVKALEEDLRLECDGAGYWPVAAMSQFLRSLIPLTQRFKDPAFRSEGERRLVYLRGTGGPLDERQVCFRPGRGFVIPFVECPIGITAGSGRLPIASIRCGPTTHSELGIAGVRQLLKEYGYDGVSVHSSTIPYRG